MSDVEKPDVSDSAAVMMDGGSDTEMNRQEFLTFMLGNEEYGIEILKVQEIRGYDNVTRIPGAPAFIKGVSNLRGLIVPIVDMRIKLELGIPSYDALTVVIILNIHGAVVGAVVDAVSDVVTLDARTIRPAPQFESAIESRFIVGLADVGERMLIVMNMETLLSNAELGMAH